LEIKRFLEGFKSDGWAVGSTLFILLISFCAIFAYVLAPDKTKFANQMHLSIHSKPPGFSCQMLVIPRASQDSQSSVFYGKINANEEIPVSEVRWSDFSLEYKRYGNATNYFEKISFDQFQGSSNKNEIAERYLSEKRFFFGAIAGYFGGWIDRLILWLINVVWSIPTLLMVIAITLALGRGYWQVFVAVGLTMWVEVARLVRGQVKSIKEELYIQASNALGFSKTRILIGHILPMVVAPLIVISAANFASAILMESGLSFLGIGAQPPMPSWGGMVKDHFRYLLLGKPYLALLPGLAIMSLVLAFMTLGNSLRDILDVRN